MKPDDKKMEQLALESSFQLAFSSLVVLPPSWILILVVVVVGLPQIVRPEIVRLVWSDADSKLAVAMFLLKIPVDAWTVTPYLEPLKKQKNYPTSPFVVRCKSQGRKNIFCRPDTTIPQKNSAQKSSATTLPPTAALFCLLVALMRLVRHQLVKVTCYYLLLIIQPICCRCFLAAIVDVLLWTCVRKRERKWNVLFCKHKITQQSNRKALGLIIRNNMLVSHTSLTHERELLTTIKQTMQTGSPLHSRELKGLKQQQTGHLNKLKKNTFLFLYNWLN